MSTNARSRAPWREIATALILSLVSATALGVILFIQWRTVWVLALASVVSLLVAGIALGRRVGEPEPLYGTLLAVSSFGLAVAVIFSGTLLEVFPEPLPGLAVGDSTFFFVWPLLQLVASVVGTVIGGKAGRGKVGSGAL